jgi:hypothetical protein
MTVDDQTRLQLHRRLEEVLGAEEANTLMAHLPPLTWQDVASKRDLAVLGSDLRAEMATLGSDLRAGMATLSSDLRAEMATLSSNLRAEMTELRSDLHAEIAAVRVEMYKGFTRQTWLLVTFVAALNSVLAGILTVAA